MESVQEMMESGEMQEKVMQAAYLTLSYPLDYARTLMQLGYEPFAPVERKFILGSTYLALPNTFQYLKYIKSVDGFLGCYRGLGPRLVQGFVCQSVYKRISAKNPFLPPPSPNQSQEQQGSRERLRLSTARSGALIRGNQICDDPLEHAKTTGWEIMSITAGIVASQPFYVIAVRSMAQFVGRETKYSSIIESIRAILDEEGILGFFGGLAPRVVGEVVYLSLSAGLMYLIKQAYSRMNEKQGQSGETTPGATVPAEVLTMMAANVVTSSITYQFHVVSSMMAINGSSLALGNYPFTKTYGGWYECWRSLADAKQLKRGSSVIGRYYTGPTIMTSNGRRSPMGFHFGPQHPEGLGFREKTIGSLYPYSIPPPPMPHYQLN